MTSISNTYSYKIRFNNNNCRENENIWKKIKEDCESGNNKYIIEMIIHYCKLPTNKNLIYLAEGVIGNNNKKIIFRKKISIYEKNDNDIIINYIINSNSEKWTCEELDDIIYGFIITAKNFNCKYITGCIEMTNIQVLRDTALSDSDSD